MTQLTLIFSPDSEDSPLQPDGLDLLPSPCASPILDAEISSSESADCDLIQTLEPLTDDVRGVTLLTGGPPCQPSSRAGQRRGEDDDRWLWQETLRVLAEAQPDSFVLETPIGITDLDFDGILFALERLGYTGSDIRYSSLCRRFASDPTTILDCWISGRLRGRGTSKTRATASGR